MLCAPRPAESRSSGFTFIEVLASLLFMAIVIPSVVTALTISNRAAISAERTNVAVQLGENRLNELLIDNTWSTGESRGEFGQEWPGFRWELTRGTWEIDSMTELTMEVFFPVQGNEQSVRLTTLVSSSTEAL